jgi:hypothetical protein
MIVHIFKARCSIRLVLSSSVPVSEVLASYEIGKLPELPPKECNTLAYSVKASMTQQKRFYGMVTSWQSYSSIRFRLWHEMRLSWFQVWKLFFNRHWFSESGKEGEELLVCINYVDILQYRSLSVYKSQYKIYTIGIL